MNPVVNSALSAGQSMLGSTLFKAASSAVGQSLPPLQMVSAVSAGIVALRDIMKNTMGLVSGFNTGDLGAKLAQAGRGGTSHVGHFVPIEVALDPQAQLQAAGNRITTPGGYAIENHGNSQVTITSPKGRTTTFAGDSHVFDAGNRHVFDWNAKTKTVSLADGAKITFNSDKAAGEIASFDVYYGNQHIQSSQVNTPKPVTSGTMNDGMIHDAKHGDGSRLWLGGGGDDWFKGNSSPLQKMVSTGLGALKFGGGFWLDAGLRCATELAGHSYAAGKNAVDLSMVKHFQPQPLKSTAASTGTADTADPTSVFQRIRENDKAAELTSALAKVQSGGSMEDVIVALLKVAIRNEIGKAKGLAGQLQDSKSAGNKDNDMLEFDLQMSMQRMQRLFETMSNAVKTIHEAQMTAARNIKA